MDVERGEVFVHPARWYISTGGNVSDPPVGYLLAMAVKLTGSLLVVRTLLVNPWESSRTRVQINIYSHSVIAKSQKLLAGLR